MPQLAPTASFATVDNPPPAALQALSAQLGVEAGIVGGAPSVDTSITEAQAKAAEKPEEASKCPWTPVSALILLLALLSCCRGCLDKHPA